jgi:hypothetical protein
MTTIRGRAAAAMKEICDLIEASHDDEELSRWVELSAEVISRKSGFPIADLAAHRRRLNKAVVDAKRLLKSMNALERARAYEAVDHRLNDALMKTIERCMQLVQQIPDLKHSGGAQVSTNRKLVAVDLAVKLMVNFGDALPTVALVEELAGVLAEVALGRDAGKISAARYFKRMEGDGYPDARARRLLDADGKQAAREWLKERHSLLGDIFFPSR